jgi:hypothetical protein
VPITGSGKRPRDADVLLNRNNLLARSGVPQYYFLLVTIASGEITGCGRMLGLAVETRATPIGPGALRHGFFTWRTTQGSFSVSNRIACLSTNGTVGASPRFSGATHEALASRRSGISFLKTRTKGALCEREGNSKVV